MEKRETKGIIRRPNQNEGGEKELMRIALDSRGVKIMVEGSGLRGGEGREWKGLIQEAHNEGTRG